MFLRRLHHLFSPSSCPPEPPLWVYLSRFRSNPIKDGSRGAVTAKHVPAEAKKKASRQIKAKKILNLLITQLNCAVTDRGNEHIFIRALWYEWGVKRETQRGNQEQLQGDGEWIKRRLLSLNRIPACTSPNIFLWGDWGPACRHLMKGGTARGPVNYTIWHPKLWNQTFQISRNAHLLLKILRTIKCCQGN